MRILLVHNFYGSAAPSGENIVYEGEKAMLELHGHDVAVYTRHSDEIRYGNSVEQLWGKIKGAMCTIGNPFASRSVARRCCEFKPDIVHFHNTFPLISPLAVRAASKFAPVVMTLHNYRTSCAAGVPTRDGKVCSLCLDKKCVGDGLRYRCYRGSLFATLPIAANIVLYRRLLPKWVTRFIVLSEFQKSKMVEYGWPKDRIMVKGNFINNDCWNGHLDKKSQIVYVGRLSREKGIETLLNAFRILQSNNLKLVIVGDGVDRERLRAQAKGMNVEFLGLRQSADVRQILAESRAAVLPSEWWETFGLTVVESMTVGTPVVVSNLGALPEIVHDGRLGAVFEAGNAQSCAAAIQDLLSRPDYSEICLAVKNEAEARYSENANYKRLMEIYSEVIKDNNRSGYD